MFFNLEFIVESESDTIQSKLNNTVKIVASNSMSAAAEDITAREATSADERLHNYIDTGVSVDGTWQRRGFSCLVKIKKM